MTRLLITGCARSGTKYIAELLKAAGINATHEQTRMAGDHGQMDWSKAGDVDVSSDTGLFIERASQEVQAVGHVVRDPHKVVASIVGRGMLDEGWGQRVRKHYPLEYDAPIDQALCYWVQHNQRVEPYGPRVSLDEPRWTLDILLCEAEIGYWPDALDRAFDRIPRNLHTYPNTPPIVYDWASHDAGLRLEAEALMQRYGLPLEVRA